MRQLPSYAVEPGDVVVDYGPVVKVERDRDAYKTVLVLDTGMRCVFGASAVLQIEDGEPVE